MVYTPIDDLTPNPWGKKLDTILDFGANKPGSDLIEAALHDNFDQIGYSDLTPGDVVSWQQDVTGFFNLPGVGPTTHQHISHVGIYAGDGQVFSKLGTDGPYELMPLDDLSKEYGTPSFWRISQ
jgi:cell wall-associated NlpC family hydrolase